MPVDVAMHPQVQRRAQQNKVGGDVEPQQHTNDRTDRTVYLVIAPKISEVVG